MLIEICLEKASTVKALTPDLETEAKPSDRI